MSKLDELKKSQSMQSSINNLQMTNLPMISNSGKLVKSNNTITGLRETMKSKDVIQHAEQIKTEVAKKIVEARTGKTYEVVFVLDNSGSCSEYVSSTMQGYNDFIRNQISMKRNEVVSTVLFNEQIKKIEDRNDISSVKTLSYYANGGTRFYDALSNVLIETMNAQDTDSRKIDHTLVVIMTDGEDNCSKRYDSEYTKKIVKQAKDRGYEFMFLGAFRLEDDLNKYAARIGFSPKDTSLYLPQFTKENFKAIETALSSLEYDSKLSEEWKKKVVKNTCSTQIESKNNNPTLQITKKW